jgi:hypothetical protein
MTGNWQHKILHFESLPPREVWKKIADQLDEEYEAGDILISKKMDDYEIIPPAFILENVLASLNSDQSSKAPARIFAFPLKQVAIAVVTIGLLAITMIYFLNSGAPSKAKNSTSSILPPVPSTNSLSSETDKKDNTELKTQSDVEVASLNRTPNKKIVPTNYNNSRNGRSVKHATLNPVLAAHAISPISVTAPPIYDGNGNIIMDESLVSAPDENYIIVTSPNGEQTKISRKFLKMLCVMNGGAENNYMNAENFQWKLRFEEWRSKLLQQASYIPTANNFLDIMDLKELLQEN